MKLSRRPLTRKCPALTLTEFARKADTTVGTIRAYARANPLPKPTMGPGQIVYCILPHYRLKELQTWWQQVKKKD